MALLPLLAGLPKMALPDHTPSATGQTNAATPYPAAEETIGLQMERTFIHY
tara:strand:- start:93 stop:245 length:153 start_codon:yes stop_codon:yes gene_type:complete